MSFRWQIVHSLRQAVKQLLRQRTQLDNHVLALNAALDLTCSKSELVLENALLRQQLVILRRQTKRLKLAWRDRSLIVLLANKLRTWKEALIIVQPGTVLRWHRDLFKRLAIFTASSWSWSITTTGSPVMWTSGSSTLHHSAWGAFT